MTSIVLVHGAWGGSYGFRQVVPLLTAAGHTVQTPSLTGLGERSHLTGDHVNLSTHIHDVYNTIFYEDLDDIVLLGFSYGGMVVTGLLDSIGDRVRHLVYLDAIVPTDGQSAAAVIGPAASALIDSATNGLIAPVPRQLETPEATAWSDARRAHQPIATFTEPVALSKPLEDWDFTRTFIKASADPDEPSDSAFWRASRHADESPAWTSLSIASNHMVPMMKPHDLSDILNAIATKPTAA